MSLAASCSDVRCISICRNAGLGLLLLLSPLFGLAESDSPDARIKAAFVFNFLKFAAWPEDALGNTVTLCLVNANAAVEDAFASIRGRTVNGRSVQVRSLSAGNDAAGCNVLYVNNGGTKKGVEQLLARSKNNLLTVGDGDDFIGAGGMIGLVEQNGRLQFEINLDVARRGSVQLSAQLLKLARNAQ